MSTATATTIADVPLDDWRAQVRAHVAGGDRFAGVYSTHHGDAAQLHAMLVGADTVSCLRSRLWPDADGLLSYPALSSVAHALAFAHAAGCHPPSSMRPPPALPTRSLLIRVRGWIAAAALCAGGASIWPPIGLRGNEAARQQS